MSVQGINENQKELLIESLTQAMINLAEDGILNYHHTMLSADCIAMDDDEGNLLPDLQAVLPLAFDPVEGFEPTHAEICGFVSFSDCKVIEVNDGEGGVKEKLIWSNPNNENKAVMNFGYHSNNLTYNLNPDINNPDNYKANDYEGWSEWGDVGITYEQDCDMGFEVANRAFDRMSPELKNKFLSELIEVANREAIAP